MRRCAFKLFSLTAFGSALQFSSACGGSTGPTQSQPQDAGLDVADANAPTVVAAGMHAPIRFFSDGAALFISDSDGKLMTVPVLGGTVTTLVSGGITIPIVGVDNTSVYYVLKDGLYAMPKVGGAATRLNDVPATVVAATLTSAGAVRVEGMSAPVAPQAVVRAPGIDIPVKDLVVSLPTGIAATTKSVFLLTPGVEKLIRDVADQTPTKIDAHLCQTLLADETAAYCIPAQGELERIDDEGTVTPLGQATADGHGALDSTYLYWGESHSGAKVARVPKTGGASTTIVNEAANAIAVDDEAIYWENLGVIKRILK